MKETEIIVPEWMLQSGEESADLQFNPLHSDRNKNVTAYPVSWSGGFGRDFYAYKKAKERMEEMIERTGPISVKGQPFKEPELHVSGREQISRTIEDLITEMKENKNE